ncbi:phosphosugar-binding transcriptional regulator [Klebsiella pneumoniae]|nr:phosphosugar-binding transcriptional regulator [Klebsiella pneumoniae]
MSMFSHAAVASLNNLEMMVYHYVIKNRDKVMYMTIRETGRGRRGLHDYRVTLLPQTAVRGLL